MVLFNGNVMLIGLGPHAKRFYIQCLRYHGITPSIIVELENNRLSTETYLKENQINSETYYIMQGVSIGDRLPNALIENLDAFILNKKITHVIIAAAAQVHLAYLHYFISRKINVITDKPITAPNFVINNSVQAQKIESEFNDLVSSYKDQDDFRVEIQCQRRYHPGYLYIKKVISELIYTFNVPITYLDVYHCDGKWNMPNEFLSENHPYKYGYGKLFHSGYHFVDITTWLLEPNYSLPDHKTADQIELYAATTKPIDALNVIDREDFSRLFKVDYADSFNDLNNNHMEKMGELDFFGLLQFIKNRNVITTCSLHLLQSGFSRRSWSKLPIDTYKGNGRLRHESVNIQLGPFANIQLHSYQAGELKDIHLDHTDAGGLHHFEILIFRNTGLIGGEPFQRVALNDLPPHRYSNASYFSTGHVERSKENCLIDFLTSNRKGESDLARHALSIRILSQAYLALSKQTTEEKKSVRFDIKDLLDSLDHSEKADHEYQNL